MSLQLTDDHKRLIAKAFSDERFLEAVDAYLAIEIEDATAKVHSNVRAGNFQSATVEAGKIDALESLRSAMASIARRHQQGKPPHA